MVQIQGGGRVVSERLRQGSSRRATSWQLHHPLNENLLGQRHGKPCPLSTAFRALQPSHRRGMQQRQGYTFAIVGVLWRRLFDAVDRVWIAQGTTERQQVFCQMCG